MPGHPRRALDFRQHHPQELLTQHDFWLSAQCPNAIAIPFATFEPVRLIRTRLPGAQQLLNFQHRRGLAEHRI
jgi:hypothetical protein